MPRTMPRGNSIMLVSLTLLFILAALSWVPGKAWAESGQISLDVRDTDIRDVLSALAIEMNATVILDTEPVKITFKAENLPPEEALSLIIQSQGLASVQNGNIIVVGKPAILQENYFDRMILTRFDTYYVTPDQIKGLISSLELDISVLSLDTNPGTLWVQGTAQSLQKVRELVNAVDFPENHQLALLEYRTVTVTQITPQRVVELLSSAGVKLNHYIIRNNQLMVFEKKLFPRWSEIETLITQLDTLDSRKEKAFVYQLKNVSAKDAAARLMLFNLGAGNEVKTITYNNDNLGHELLVICPPYLEGAVRDALSAIDLTRSKINAPVASAKGAKAYDSISNTRSLLSEMSGVSVSSMRISGNLSVDGVTPLYVLWANETPDKIKKLQDLAASFSSGGED
ncbi:MAG: energy transducer TonB [Bacillota bacterium]